MRMGLALGLSQIDYSATAGTGAAAPTVTGVSPSSGSTAGGTTVTITGTDFTGATAVSFGGTAAASFTVNSATQITATSPAVAASTVTISVTTSGGTSANNGAADDFAFVAPAPTVSARSQGKTGTSNVSSHAITLPTITVGERLVAAIACDAASSGLTLTVDTGVSGSNWSEVGTRMAGSLLRVSIFSKIAEGGDALTITSSATEMSSHVCWSIANGATISGAIADSGAGGSADANPPNLNLTTSAETLLLTVAGFDAQVVPSAAPSGYSQLRTETHGSTAGASIGCAERTATVSAEDPSVFTSTTEQWVAATIGIRA